MPSQGELGVAALQARNYTDALTHLDRAVAESTSPTWLLARSQLHQKLKDYDAALRDAELAYHTAAERGSGKSREQMMEAQYRRAVALLHMKRYADADCCFKWSQLLIEGRAAKEEDGVEKNVDENGFYSVTVTEAKGDTSGQPKQKENAAASGGLDAVAAHSAQMWSRAYMMRNQALTSMERLPADDPHRKVTVSKIPARPTLETKKAVKQPVTQAVPKTADPKPAPVPGSIPDEKLKSRADFYQTNTTVTISLFIKNINKDVLEVRFNNKSVVLGGLPREAAPYVKPGDREAYSTIRLGGEIDKEKSRYSVTPRKIELVLQKKTPNVKWGTWGEEIVGPRNDNGDEVASVQHSSPAPVPVPAPAPNQSTAAPAQQNPPDVKPVPAYPTSSKSGPKNWDKVVETEDAADEDGKDVNAFFKSLFANATPEQQRAMMKSFTESNGTALSTDWNDVGSRKVDMVPPEGVEPKKWDS
jgi:suppressor of G2 allele of SKP1